MSKFTKLDAIRNHLQLSPPAPQTPARKLTPVPVTGKRVQKNLSILECDAERLKSLAERDRISQAQLLSAALDAYSDRKQK